jgi:hypothetical protein
MKHYIYGLYDPRDEKIRYVGRTSNLEDRLRQHIYDGQGSGRDTKRLLWIKELKVQNLRPIIKVLEEVDGNDVEEKEKYYINYHISNGANLTNKALITIEKPRPKNLTDGTNEYISPSQAAREFNVVQRRVYRWIERKQVKTHTEGDRKLISRDSVVELLRKEQLRQLANEVIGTDTQPAELKESVTTSIVRNDVERSQLYAKSLEDARTIGELTQKTRHLDTLEIEVSGLRKRVERLIQYRVLFWVLLVLFVVAVVIFSVLLYVNT